MKQVHHDGNQTCDSQVLNRPGSWYGARRPRPVESAVPATWSPNGRRLRFARCSIMREGRRAALGASPFRARHMLKALANAIRPAGGAVRDQLRDGRPATRLDRTGGRRAPSYLRPKGRRELPQRADRSTADRALVEGRQLRRPAVHLARGAPPHQCPQIPVWGCWEIAPHC